MKTIQLLILAMTLTNAVLAQNKGNFVGAFTSEKQIFLRWVRENDGQSFNIYRKAADEAEYIRVNERPVMLMTTRQEIMSLLGDDYPGFKKAFKLDYPEQITTVYQHQPGFLDFAAVYTPKLAVLLGEGFIDNTILPNRTYYYMIEVNDGTTTRKLVEDFKLKSESKKTDPPGNFRVLKGKGFNELFWDTDNKNTTGYYIYRSETGEKGNYIKLNALKLIFTQNTSVSNASPNYVDTAVDSKQNYWYKVVGVNIFNEEGMFSPAITLNP